MKYQDLISGLSAEFPGHHVEIRLFPSGGIIDLVDCEECGSKEGYSQSWRYRLGTDIDSAIEALKARLAKTKEEKRL